MSQHARRHLDGREHCDGLNRFQLSRVYMHFGLVVISMLTTTFLYVALALLIIVHPIENELRWTWNTYVFVAWLLDSVCNDFCMLVLGFSPTSESRPAAKEGKPTSDANESDVVGEIIGASTMTL